MTGVRQRTSVRLTLLIAALLAIGRPALAQTPLTLDDAMTRARGETADARTLASAIAEADARVQRAQSGFWPRVDVSETVQRGNQPVFVFSSLLSQRRFTAANFAISALTPSAVATNAAIG